MSARPGEEAGAKQLLAGVRVVDFTHMLSGPYGTSLLGAMGAEVLKIESVQRPDAFRLQSPGDASDPHWFEKAPVWNAINTNKLGVTLDLGSQAGREICLEIIKKSDVLVENFSPRVMRDFGFEYGRLSKINPKLIMVDMSCFGQAGPWRDFAGFAYNFEQLGGAAALTGYEDGTPCHMAGGSDIIAGLTAIFSILVALQERETTGLGQHVDLSQVESIAFLLGKYVIEYQLTGEIQPLMGNRHPIFAPHNTYPCLGDDQWVTIAVTSDDEWAALSQAMGKPQWANDSRFSTLLARKRNERVIDKRISEWTRARGKHEVMQLLQSYGVPAGSVLHPSELLEDAQLKSRRVYKRLDRLFVGEHAYPRFPLLFSDAVCQQRFPAPTLGQHTEEVLTGLLALTEEEIERLRAGGVIGTRPHGL